jgi:hypothetical protein
MNQLLGDSAVHPESLAKMRERGGTWAAYQCHDLGHADMGQLQFLKYGALCTIKTPPDRLPDTRTRINWRYLLVGFVDVVSGQIVETPR